MRTCLRKREPMRRMLITTIVCIGFIGVCSQSRAQSQPGLEITAKVVGTKCDLPKAPPWPHFKEDKDTVEKNVPGLTGCEWLENQIGPAAVVLTTFSNHGQTKIELPIENLDVVTATTKDGKKQSAAGMMWRHFGFFGIQDYVYGVVHDMKAPLTMVLEP